MDQDLRQTAGEAHARWRVAPDEENRLREECDAAMDRLAASRTTFKAGDIVKRIRCGVEVLDPPDFWRVDRVIHDWRAFKKLDAPPLLACTYIRANGSIGKMTQELPPDDVVLAGTFRAPG